MTMPYPTKRNPLAIDVPGEAAPIAVIGEHNVHPLLTGLAGAPQLGREGLATNFEMALGSASAIFASGIGRLGHPVNFYSRVGDDDFGHFYLKALQDRGISTSKINISRDSRTGVTVALSMASDRALVIRIRTPSRTLAPDRWCLAYPYCGCLQWFSPERPPKPRSWDMSRTSTQSDPPLNNYRATESGLAAQASVVVPEGTWHRLGSQDSDESQQIESLPEKSTRNVSTSLRQVAREFRVEFL